MTRFMIPGSGWSAEQGNRIHSVFIAVKAALEVDGPVYLRFGRTSSPPVYTKETARFTVGKGNVLKDGSDVTLMAIGDLVSEALSAARKLEDRGISAAVIDMPSVKPIDQALILEYAEKTRRIITAEDHNIIGGLGSAVAEVLAEHEGAILRRVGVKDCFGCSGKRRDLQELFGLDEKAILEAVKEIIEF